MVNQTLWQESMQGSTRLENEKGRARGMDASYGSCLLARELGFWSEFGFSASGVDFLVE